MTPDRGSCWNKLALHARGLAGRRLRDLFQQDPGRFSRFSLQFEDILLDYSKNLIEEETLALLFDLARERGVEELRDRMFQGDPINSTENRPALHIALRNCGNRPIRVQGQDVMPAVNAALEHLREFSTAVRSGAWTGWTGKPIRDVVQLGIGGSCLGPEMVTEALQPYARGGPKLHFVSNVDEAQLLDTLRDLDQETTLFCIASKSFTTQETLTNAASAKEWFLRSASDEKHVARHFVALSAKGQKVRAFGIDPANMFVLWDWVGGRYSLWSSVGLPIALAIGFERFTELLEGAHAMDEHFQTAPPPQNLPLILGLMGIWNNNFLGAAAHAVLPYDHRLRRLPAYLQQLDMESNGKSTDREGRSVDYQTGPIIFGEPGTNGQHAFYQLIHQGTQLISCDFLAAVRAHQEQGRHHEILLANFLAQTEALMRGRTSSEVRRDLKASGHTPEQIEVLLPHLLFSGNRPSTSILYDLLSPRTLGSLLALYEHRTFTMGAIWNIDSFDQWGVELGKKLARTLLKELADPAPSTPHDASTSGLLKHCWERRRRFS